MLSKILSATLIGIDVQRPGAVDGLVEWEA
jgi:hypothetical protein